MDSEKTLKGFIDFIINDYIDILLDNPYILTSLFFILFLFYIFFINYKKLNKRNYYSVPLNLLLIFSLMICSIFIFKLINIDIKYMFFKNMIVDNENVTAGIGIGISALLAGISMLYNIENEKIKKDDEEKVKQNKEINTINLLIDKILNLIQEEKRNITHEGIDIPIYIRSTKFTLDILKKDLTEIIKFSEYFNNFNNLNNFEKAIRTYSFETTSEKLNKVSLTRTLELAINSLNETKKDIKQLNF